MINNVKKIVIVGGGSAGWMTASTLIKYYPEKEIVVIESPNIPTVGVGESTLGAIRDWVNALEIDEKDFMNYTDASYKMSIKFTNFYDGADEGFHYPFGIPFTGHLAQDIQAGPEDMLKLWQIKKSKNKDLPVQDYCRTFWSTMPLIENNKFSLNKKGLFDNYHPKLNLAYHFDAAKFGEWLKEKYSMPKGVSYIQKEVNEILTDENGISKLILEGGEEVSADLYIDCTGFKSLLLGQTLNEPFNSFSDILPNNRAWAVQIPYTDKEKEMEPFTNCTALGNGWAWNIPLWSRIGTGYVYSNKYISSEDALQEFKDYLNSEKMAVHNPNRVTDDLQFKDIKMRIGRHERMFVKNVVAIGLSAGFIEPLESNGLFSVHKFLFYLIDALNRGPVSEWDRNVYNFSCSNLFDGFAEFVALHYGLSHRSDTEYWKDTQKRNLNIDNTKINSSFLDLAKIKALDLPHNSLSGLHCISVGLKFWTYGSLNAVTNPTSSIDPMKQVLSQFNNKTKMLQLKWESEAKNSPTLYEYLRNFYNED